MEPVGASNCVLSVIIKTLNEEKNIGRCIEAILNSNYEFEMEIIVADSCSSDKTVEIASTYPVTVVQLANPTERCCGIGPQLGYQHSKGQFVLILDADMVLHKAFVIEAIARMNSNPHCAGIGGQLAERAGTGYEYELRQSMMPIHDAAVRWLDGGGIYRRDAIERVGYLSNRNLHAYEEKELGLRLLSAGWQLFRISTVAVDHYGHSANSIRLLWRRWKSGYADACGESIRASIGKPYFLDMIMVHKNHIIFLAMLLGLLFSIFLAPWYRSPLIVSVSLMMLAFAAQTIKKRSIKTAAISFLHLTVFALGLARGLFRSHRNPMHPIQSILVSH